MKLIRKILLVVGIIILSCVFITSCSLDTNKDSDITGTYYLYEEDQLDKDSYYIITSSSWTDENNDSGTYKLNGTTIIFYMSESGNEELYRGTIGDGKLEITFEGIKTTYYKEGSEPSSGVEKDVFYTITFKDYDGTVLYTSSVKKGSNAIYNGTTPKRDGYVFIGWDNSLDDIKSNMVFTAVYEEAAPDVNVYYTVTFKDYDGTVLQISSVKKGETPAYNKSNPSRENDDNYSYTFSGWQPTLTEVSEDAIYTATYTSQALPYYVIIDLDGGTSSATKLQFKTDKISKDMLPLDVKKNGYVFKGYSLNDVKVYDENGNAVSNYQPSANMTFEAIYEESVTLTVFYTIYNPKTGQLIETFNEKPTDMGNVSETRNYNYNTYVDLFAFANEGYTFVGWYNEGQVLSNDKDYKYMMWNEDFTIEARFSYTLYDLTVWSNNNDLGQVMIRNGNSQVFYNEETLEEHYTESVTIVAYSKTDTRFLGWYNEKNELVSTNAVYTFDMLNRDYTLEAKWNSFDITYDLGGGVNNSSNPTNYNVDTQNITLLAPTKDGYTFQGWQYNGNVITQINTANICHMSLKALWTANTNTPYKVEHYLQNIDNNNYTLYETDNLTGRTDTKTAGSVKTYEGFKSPSITQVNINGNGNTVVKLYYTRNSYNVTVDKNEIEAGTVSGGGTYKFNKQITIFASSNNGYTWDGWYVNDEKISDNLELIVNVPAYDAIYIAKWNYYTLTLKKTDGGKISTSFYNGSFVGDPNPTITFDYNNGKGTYLAVTLNNNDKLSYPSNPSYLGYVFRGWFTEPECSNVYDFTQMIFDDLTLYAGWQKMYTDNVNSNSIVDATAYTSEYNYARTTYHDTSSSKYNYRYFTCYTSGRKVIYYKNYTSQSDYVIHIYIYNMTQEKVILAEKNCSNTNYYSISFDANAGDVICIRAWEKTVIIANTWHDSSPLYYYFKDVVYPDDGGTIANPAKISVGENVTIIANTDPNYIFSGWYKDDILVSTDEEYSFTMNSKNAIYEARWTGIV